MDEPQGEEKLKTGPSVLFVCTANICRSPLAAALFVLRLQQEDPGWQRWQVASAGTWAMDGERATRFSQEVAARRGLDISQHRSQMVTSDLLDSYDLILTMEPGHKEALQIEFPEAADRVFLLTEMVGESGPVEDPYGHPVEEYEKMAVKVGQLIAQGMPRIRSLLKKWQRPH